MCSGPESSRSAPALASSSARSNGAQLPGARAQRAGARRDAVAGAQATCKGHGGTCAKDNVQGTSGSGSLFWQAIAPGSCLQKRCRLTHLPVSFFPLFPLSGRFFQSFAALRLGCCSSNIQPNCIHGGFILICPWASIVLYPTRRFSLLLSFSPTFHGWLRTFIPLWLFLPALSVSILERLENPLQLLSILKDRSVQGVLCNISAFLVSVGHIP